MTDVGMTRRNLDTIPAALNLVLHEALWQCRENPPTDWSSDAYYLLQRPDLAVQAEHSNHVNSTKLITIFLPQLVATILLNNQLTRIIPIGEFLKCIYVYNSRSILFF